MTNKYAKVFAGIDELEGHHSQIHVPGISSATNRLKKSFNFETGALVPHYDVVLTESQQQESRAKNQELLNQILLQNPQLAGSLNFMTNPATVTAPGTKYLSANGNSTVTASSSVRQSQKHAKLQNMKTQQLVMLQQQYAQAQSLQ